MRKLIEHFLPFSLPPFSPPLSSLHLHKYFYIFPNEAKEGMADALFIVEGFWVIPIRQVIYLKPKGMLLLPCDTNGMCCLPDLLPTNQDLLTGSKVTPPHHDPNLLPYSLPSSWLPLSTGPCPPGSLSLSPIRTTVTKETRKAKSIF